MAQQHVIPNHLIDNRLTRILKEEYPSIKRDHIQDAKVALKLWGITSELRKSCEPLISKPFNPIETERLVKERLKQMTEEMDRFYIEGSFDPE